MGFTDLKGSPCVGYQADSSKLRSYQAGCYISLVQSDRLLHFFGPIRQIVTFLWSNQTDCYISLAQSDRLLPIDMIESDRF